MSPIAGERIVAGGRIDDLRYVVTADHEISDRAPLILKSGEAVQVGVQDTEWPAFVFVTACHGTPKCW